MPKPSSKTFQGGEKSFNEQGLPEGNPDVVHGEISAEEVLDVQVFRESNRLRMLRQSVVEHRARRRVQPESAFASAFWNSLADIDRDVSTVVCPVPCRDWLVRRKLSHVVDGVNTGGGESFRRWQRRPFSRQERIRDTRTEVSFVQRIERSLQSHLLFPAESRDAMSRAMMRPSSTGTAFPSWRMFADQELPKTKSRGKVCMSAASLTVKYRTLPSG